MDSVIRKRAEEQFRARREDSENDDLKKVARAPVPPFSRQKQDYKINDLPNLQRTRDPSFEMYGGHVPSTTDSESNSHLYFALVEARQKTDRTRTIFWFNGGPGCSSFDALMMEVGPFNLIKNEKGELGLKEKEYGWHEYANIVFIDQPVGTGYSYAQTDSYVHELDQAADQFITFLNNFYEIFPELKNTDTYISGESYAGQYVPYFANKVIETPDLPLNLKGLMIGNGWIDPISQYPAYAQFAHAEGLIQPGTKADKEMMDLVERCEKSLNSALTREEKTGILQIYISECELIMDQITGSHRKYENGKATCLNTYDYRLRDEYPACGMNWPNELHDVTEYLRKESVTKAFNARARAESWTECNVKVSRELTAIHSTASVRLLPKILKYTKVLLFAGDKDIVCNYQGIENLVDNLEWNGGKGFSGDTPQLWSMHGNPVGEWQAERNLTYVRVYNASHMVPIDAPEPMLDLITRYMEVDLKSVKSSDNYNFESAVGDINEFGEEDSSVSWAGSHKKSGSFALLLIIIGVAVGGFLWIRRRRRQMLVHDYSQLRANTLSQEQEQGIETSDRRSNEQIESERLFDVGSDIDSDEGDSNKHKE
ncbi:alpha/beta-hydrolase [Wallemia mellicola]|nr:alpha/beta-hydrolase [Wallemia mellicola]